MSTVQSAAPKGRWRSLSRSRSTRAEKTQSPPPSPLCSPASLQRLAMRTANLFDRTAEDEEIEEDEHALRKEARLRALVQGKVGAGTHPADREKRARANDAHDDDADHFSRRKLVHDEDDYVARTKAWREQQRDSLPRLKGLDEDANPIINYIIKSRKQKRGHAREDAGRMRPAGSSSVNAHVLANVIQGARTHNQLADSRQLDGARARLTALGHEDAVVLMTERLNGPSSEAARHA